MKKTMIAALLGATLLTSGAMAAVQDTTQPQDAPKHRMMRDPLLMADANKDGIVTREEITASLAARFANVDANKDGKITIEERQAAREAMRAKMGDGMGRRMRGGPGMRGPKGDGIVTLDEQRTRALEMFDFVDRNGDGKVDQAERELVHKMMRKMGGGRGHGGHRRHHGGGDMPPPPPPAG